MNVKPQAGDSFLYKELWRFIPPFDTYPLNKRGLREKRTITTFIELEVYPSNICVVAFYNEGFGSGKQKYKKRSNLGVGHIKAILTSCLQVFFEEKGRSKQHHALVFTGADDEVGHVEDNKRNQLYSKFIDYSWPKKLENYHRLGSNELNTFMLVHQHHPYIDQCRAFFKAYQQKVEQELLSDPTEEK